MSLPIAQEPEFEPLRTLEIFAGAGGLALGLKQVRFALRLREHARQHVCRGSSPRVFWHLLADEVP
jgi:hypothetical protein